MGRDKGAFRTDFRFSVCSPLLLLPIKVFMGRLFGTSKRLLDIWSSLITSPVLTLFVVTAHHLRTCPERTSHSPCAFLRRPVGLHSFLYPYSLSGLLALRRGNYLEHCNVIANWSARIMGFNAFSELPDRLSPLAVPDWSNAPPEELALRTAPPRSNRLSHGCARCGSRSCQRRRSRGHVC